MTVEEWRQVVGSPDYQVSDRGRVISYKRKTPKVMRLTRQKGYLHVTIAMGALGRVRRTVHSLVAEAFIGPRPTGLQVRHLDGDGENNQVANLAYGTNSENMQDRLRHGRDPNAKKTHCPQGHPYSGPNLYIAPSTGNRDCRVCSSARARAANQRKRLRAAGIAA